MRRTNSIQESIDTAEEKNREAERLSAEYNRKLELAHEEGREIVETQPDMRRERLRRL